MSRSLDLVEVREDDAGNPVLMCVCDCGEACAVTVVLDRDNPEDAEFAITCDGCLSVHWMRIVL